MTKTEARSKHSSHAEFIDRIRYELSGIESEGLTKPERVISSHQGPEVIVDGEAALNFCANNYLGLAGDPRVAQAAIEAIEERGSGLASVRFICGTLDLHKRLERATADWLGYDDAILFAAAFDANGGVFEPLLGAQDAIVSDSLNHASIIDGVRLSKAKRYRFANADMVDLEAQLKAAREDGARTVLIATDGVFSMDGIIAPLDEIAALGERYGALVMVDDCHATGLIGPGGRGSGPFKGVGDKIDILTGTYGKALGGAMGGFICAAQPVIDLLRQRARPYLFSNALAPAVCGSALKAIEIAASDEGDALRSQLAENAAHFRGAMDREGFELLGADHAIVPVLLGDAAQAQRMAARLVENGIFVTGFSFPVVPRGQARIRVQLSAAHTPGQIDQAVAAFVEARAALA
ncbi:MAG: glycine C-acetyltransferase [Erythrobacter sp.]|uniref:glycine C-acetyltransferase n=1 Tax=Erythrobacter sp. TaxID=1042 RepID=UPI00262E97B0|nr:glycine C-acetyltransferase [Erythrobacter sp.]MDJ0978171.1 glycine C-acetyltransferase [Erythrobacter sp.]